MKIEIVKVKGGFRWKAVAGNGKVLFQSLNAYPEKRRAIQAVKDARVAFLKAEIVEA